MLIILLIMAVVTGLKLGFYLIANPLALLEYERRRYEYRDMTAGARTEKNNKIFSKSGAPHDYSM